MSVSMCLIFGERVKLSASRCITLLNVAFIDRCCDIRQESLHLRAHESLTRGPTSASLCARWCGSAILTLTESSSEYAFWTVSAIVCV